MTLIPEKAEAGLEAMRPDKITTLGAIGKARETIIGSGSMRQEIAKVGDSALNIPLTILGTPLQSLGKLVTLHPVEAVKKMASGASEIIHSTVDLVTSPARLGVAGISGAADIGKGALQLPFKTVDWAVRSPFYAFNTLESGFNRFESWSDAVGKRAGARFDNITKTGQRVVIAKPPSPPQ